MMVCLPCHTEEGLTLWEMEVSDVWMRKAQSVYEREGEGGGEGAREREKVVERH